MPIGNGDITANVWIESSGDLVFYIGKSDSWGEFGQLYKVGRVRIKFHDTSGQKLLVGENLRWELRPQTASIHAQAARIKLKIWVDAHAPCIRILAEGAETMMGELSVEIWRKEKRNLYPSEQLFMTSHAHAPYSMWHGPDTLVETSEDEILWFHQNTYSSWRSNLELQGLGNFISTQPDPLMNRTFGGIITGERLKKVNNNTLQSIRPSSSLAAQVTIFTGIFADPSEWIQKIRQIAHSVQPVFSETAWRQHVLWWKGFWERSWISADGNEAARKVTQSYSLQRYLNACAGRGAYPIKFNGSLFTVDWNYDGEAFDADYRRWGGDYWHQNTRLIYWPMLAAGDYDLMLPYFRMYLDALPLARERCYKINSREGAAFPEVMPFWGSFQEFVYGWPDKRPKNLPTGLPLSEFVRYYNSGCLELIYLSILYYKHTLDDDFLARVALPLAEAYLSYYDCNFPRDRKGKLCLKPAQVLEQWWPAKNPLPEIAGLHACLEALLSLDQRLLPKDRINNWKRLLTELPPLPTRQIHKDKFFAPAESWNKTPHNCENPELYAIFPYQRCHLLSKNLEIGLKTFAARIYKQDISWNSNGIQAACLGLTLEARESVIRRFCANSSYARFPAFWGPRFDWIPDQDHGNVAALTLQLMCMQEVDNTLLILPAWPEDWSVSYQLHAQGKSTILGNYQPGSEPQVTCPDARKAKILLQRRGSPFAEQVYLPMETPCVLPRDDFHKRLFRKIFTLFRKY